MTRDELNKKLTNTVTGNDVVEAVKAATAAGKVSEKITTTNFKEHVDAVNEYLYEAIMSAHPEFNELNTTAKEICRSRTKGLLRYLAVNERI